MGRFSLLLLVLIGGSAIGYVAGGNRIAILDFRLLGSIVTLGLLIPIFVRNTSWALIVLVVIFPFLFLSEVTIFGITLFNAVGMLLTGVWLSRVLLLKQPIVYWKWMWLAAIAMMLIVVSTLFAGLSEASVRALIRIISLFLMFFVIVQVVDSEKILRRIGWAFVISATLSAGLGILAFIFQWDLRPGPQDLFGTSAGITGDVTRFHGVVGGPQGTGFHMVLASILVLQFMSLYKQPGIRYLLVVALLLLLVQLFLTVSMTSILILTVLVPLASRGHGIGLWASLMRWLLLGSILLGLLYFSVGNFRDRLNVTVNDLGENSSSSWGTGRGELWEAGYNTAMEFPLLGPGAGNGYFELVKYLSPDHRVRRSNVRPENQNTDPHNAFLGVAANFGWITLGLLVIVLIQIGRSLYRNLAATPKDSTRGPLGMALALVLLAVAFNALSADISRSFLPYLFLGLAVAFIRISSQPESPPLDPSLPLRPSVIRRPLPEV